MPKQFKDFLNSIPHKFSPEQDELLGKAFSLAQAAHKGQKRQSGEDYFIHAREAAIILGKIFPDVTTLCATLLHDVPEDTDVSLEEIKKQLGNEVSELIDGVTQLGHVRMKDSKDKFYVENLRKLFIATSKDIRVILIKLADRLHNMRTIQYIPPEKQIKVAKETLEIYAPIAARLGIGSWKDELEDLSFKIVFPQGIRGNQTAAGPRVGDSPRGRKINGKKPFPYPAHRRHQVPGHYRTRQTPIFAVEKTSKIQ